MKNTIIIKYSCSSFCSFSFSSMYVYVTGTKSLLKWKGVILSSDDEERESPGTDSCSVATAVTNPSSETNQPNSDLKCLIGNEPGHKVNIYIIKLNLSIYTHVFEGRFFYFLLSFLPIFFFCFFYLHLLFRFVMLSILLLIPCSCR